MSSKIAAISKKIGFYALAGYFFASTFSHALGQIFMGLALLLTIISFFSGKQYKEGYKPGWFALFVFSFIGWSIISALVGPTPLKSLFVLKEEWLFLMIPAGAFVIDDEKKIRTILTVLAISAILMALYAVFQHFTGIDLYHGTVLAAAPSSGYRVSGNFSNRLTFGNYFTVVSLLFLGIGSGAPRGWRKILFFGAFFLGSLATVFTYSRGPIIVLAIGIVAALILLEKKNRKIILITLAAAIVIIVAVSPDILSRYVTSAQTEWEGKYAGSRLSIWKTAGRMISDHPIFGVGQGNFSEEFPKYRDLESDRAYAHAHNDIINVAAYAGIPGAVFFLAFWAAIAAGLMKLFRILKDRNDMRGMAAGILLGSVGFFMTSVYEATFADEEIRLFLMALWGLYWGMKLTLSKQAIQPKV
jgi:oligosaccharide repeat unit polymerase